MSCIRSRAPSASSDAVRKVMQANVGHPTGIEVELRRTLYELGVRFRKDIRPEHELRCKADIVFPGYRICIFVDGCFWHGCGKHFRTPRTNSGWWNEKIQANIERDRKQTHLLRARGWQVIRIWEHDLEKGKLRASGLRILRRVLEKQSTRDSRTRTH